LLPDYAALTIGIHAVYPSRKHLPIKTRRMVDFLVAAFATPPWSAEAHARRLTIAAGRRVTPAAGAPSSPAR
jgi:hypothetical protein